MTKAPERIWADGNAEWDSGSWGLDKEFDSDVEYVQADRIEELEAKLAKAVEALEVTLDCIGALSKPHELYGHGLQENEIKWIFATLAKLKGNADGRPE